MQFRGNSDRLQQLIEKIQANKENNPSQPSQEEGETSASETTSEAVDSDLGYSFGVTDTTPYQCQFCDKAFPRLGYLKKHEQSHSEHMPFRCDFCRRLFKHKRSRDRHVKLHTGDKKYRCSQCVAAFSRSDHLKIHMKTHDNQKPYQCNYCNRGYNTAAALTSHLQNHKREIISRNSDNNKLSCSQCNILFSNPEEHAVHMANKDHETEASPKTKTTSSNINNEFMNNCKFCLKNNFSSYEEMQKHVQSCQECCNSNAEKSNREYPHGSSLIVENICPLCFMSFSSEISLSAHISISHGPNQMNFESELSCKKCFIPFPNSRSMIEHWLYFHSMNNSGVTSDQIKPTDLSMVRKLNEEDRPNKKKTRLKEMESSVIQEETQYDPGTLLCNQCNAALPDFESFRTHLKSHLEESSQSSKLSTNKIRFSACSYCRMPISSVQEMVKHIATHILTTVTEYSCNICQKLFSTSAELEQHLMEVHSHHLFLCYACKEVFDTRFGMQRHFTMKHLTETRKYACRLCQTSPPLKSETEFEHHVRNFHCGFDTSLTLHDVSLQCAYCNEVCKSRSELENHMKLHCQSALSFGKHKCNICDEICHTASTLAEHKLTHCKVIYGSICSHCKATISSEDNFLSHMINHNNGLSSKAFQLTLPVSCVICRQTLISEFETRLHAKFHLQIENSQCSMCLQIFSKCDMKDKVCVKCLEGRNTPKCCPQCDITVSTFSELETHISEEHKMLKCNKCKSFFNNKDEYDTHFENSCVNDASQELKCNICLMMLPNEAKLQAHLIEHTFIGCANFTCYICGAVFTIALGLQRHISEHGNSLKPYACTRCNMKFFFRAELDNHLFLHQMNAPVPIIKFSNSIEHSTKSKLQEPGPKVREDNNNNSNPIEENMSTVE